MFSTANFSKQRFFTPAQPQTPAIGQITLGNFSTPIPFCKLPDGCGYFLYFKLNDHPTLVEEGARLIAERIRKLELANPYFVTPEASTLALAHVLRSKYHIQGATIYKTAQINDVDPISIIYDTVTSDKKKTLCLGKNKIEEMQDKDIIILDSVCTTGGTIRGVYELLIKAGIAPQKIVEATMLFNEGHGNNHIMISDTDKVKLHSFSYLPIIKVLNKPKAGLQIALGSISPLKINAVKNEFAEFKAEVIGQKVDSGVNEQPEEEQILEGSKNRALAALALTPDADIVIGIENGISKLLDHEYYDFAVIYCLTKADNYQTPVIVYSEPVKFDKECVEIARLRGFNKCTVAEVMKEKGLITDAKDPHKSLTGRSRESYLTGAFVELKERILTVKKSSGLTL